MATATRHRRGSHGHRWSLCLTALALTITHSACGDSAIKAVSEEDGAAGLSSFVRDGALKDPFAAEDRDKDRDRDDAKPRGAAAGSPGLKDPFADGASAVDGRDESSGALKDPFADARPSARPEATPGERGDKDQLKNPFAADPKAGPADTNAPSAPADPFADAADESADADGPEPRSSPRQTPTRRTDVDGSDATLKDPFENPFAE